MKRSHIIRLTAAALALTVLTGCGSPASSDADSAAEDDSPYHLRINYSSSLCLAPIQVAKELGYFEEEGVDAEFVRVEAAHVQEALAAGQIDAGMGLIGKFLPQVENGLPIRFTAGIHSGCIKIMAPKGVGIDSIADLKGKRIGVSGLAGAEVIITKRVLADEGISFDEKNPEVEFVVFAMSDLAQALENGSVDVIVAIDPTAAQVAEQYDLNILLDTASSNKFKDEYCCDTFVSASLAEQHPEVAAAYTRAVLRASAYVEAHPEETAQLQIDKKYVAGDAAFNAAILSSYNYTPSVQGGYDAILDSVTQLSEIGVLKTVTDAKAFTDDLYLFLDGVPDTYTTASVDLPDAALAV